MNETKVFFFIYLYLVSASENIFLIKAHEKPTPLQQQQFCLFLQMPNSYLLFYHKDPSFQYDFTFDCPLQKNVVHVNETVFQNLWGNKMSSVFQKKAWWISYMLEFSFVKLCTPCNINHLYVFEPDVRWIGSLEYGLLQLSKDTDSDFLCMHPRFIHQHRFEAFLEDGNWWSSRGAADGHSEVRAPNFLNDIHVFQRCWTFFVRYSKSLLNEIIERYIQHDLWMQQELFVSTICTIRMEDCKVRDITMIDPSIIGSPFFIVQGLEETTQIVKRQKDVVIHGPESRITSPNEWRALELKEKETSTTTIKLYHPIKI